MPFISIHHLEAVDPFYPGLSSLEGLKLFTKAMRIDPRSFLQRSICHDHSRRLTFSISIGYVVQVFPNIVYPRDLEPSELSYSAWNGIHHRNEFDIDTKDPIKSICKKPVLFFLKDVRREGETTLGSYAQHRERNDMRTLFCFPRSPPLGHVQAIEVLGHPLSKNWHLVSIWENTLDLYLVSLSCLTSLFPPIKSCICMCMCVLFYLEQVPRRLCCKLKQATGDALKITVRQCEKGSFSSLMANLWMRYQNLVNVQLISFLIFGRMSKGSTEYQNVLGRWRSSLLHMQVIKWRRMKSLSPGKGGKFSLLPFFQVTNCISR